MRAGKILWTLMLVLPQMSCDRGESNISVVESNPSPVASSTPPTAAPTPDPEAVRSATPTPATTETASRDTSQDQAMEDKLMGSWIAEDVDAKIGEVKIKLTFRKEGQMKLAAWSDIPFAGQVRDKTAPYEVNGDVISSEAIRGGTSVTYWFEGEQLVIRYKEGKTVKFDRP